METDEIHTYCIIGWRPTKGPMIAMESVIATKADAIRLIRNAR